MRPARPYAELLLRAAGIAPGGPAACAAPAGSRSDQKLHDPAALTGRLGHPTGRRSAVQAPNSRADFKHRPDALAMRLAAKADLLPEKHLLGGLPQDPFFIAGREEIEAVQDQVD